MGSELSGKKVLVIGGSRYLGEAIARRAADAGAAVVVAARDAERASAVASELPRGSAIRLDLTDEADIAAAAAELGTVDHIVITASAHHNAPVSELDYPSMVGAFDAKVFGPLLVAKHFAPLLPPTGSIVLFSGIAAWKPSPPYTIMGVSNGAVEFLAAHLAVELAPVRVNAISPGIVDSGTWDALGADTKQGLLEGAAAANLVGRAGTADDIAEAALWLLTAGFVSGETIHVEGGARHA
ncbi:SDR family oxidoreductase [Protaetiibacter intestinalis]|uniref:SDR family oxidoreductase n=1 Tax=Protaetiibacter intestinalis TaxID=2419774 RepID=A0A387B6F4_9MICO|nr:SDR family oxidoreductase [Protaetiibacter intestinalis]AYF99242.1 SDR family oxidoreductase [Protaetiibacter intestinalis]